MLGHYDLLQALLSTIEAQKPPKVTCMWTSGLQLYWQNKGMWQYFKTRQQQDLTFRPQFCQHLSHLHSTWVSGRQLHHHSTHSATRHRQNPLLGKQLFTCCIQFPPCLSSLTIPSSQMEFNVSDFSQWSRSHSHVSPSLSRKHRHTVSIWNQHKLINTFSNWFLELHSISTMDWTTSWSWTTVLWSGFFSALDGSQTSCQNFQILRETSTILVCNDAVVPTHTSLWGRTRKSAKQGLRLKIKTTHYSSKTISSFNWWTEIAHNYSVRISDHTLREPFILKEIRNCFH